LKWGQDREDGRSREVAQTMYTLVSKCKNNKVKERKQNSKDLEEQKQLLAKRAMLEV
jgi:hypothetical protein